MVFSCSQQLCHCPHSGRGILESLIRPKAKGQSYRHHLTPITKLCPISLHQRTSSTNIRRASERESEQKFAFSLPLCAGESIIWATAYASADCPAVRTVDTIACKCRWSGMQILLLSHVHLDIRPTSSLTSLSPLTKPSISILNLLSFYSFGQETFCPRTYVALEVCFEGSRGCS